METNISIVILTLNEADNIVRALNSAKFSDDIILIDNSTDETCSLVQKIVFSDNLRIIKNPINNDFSKLRNRGLELARHEWVLFLDADEEVNQELKQEILEVIKSNVNNGYLVKRNDFFLGKWLKYGETKDQYLLKLGRKGFGLWTRSVHETWGIKGNIGKLNSTLLHYPHPTIAEFLGRINRWTSLDAVEFYRQGVRSNFFKILAYPLGKFIKNYFFKLGLLDGMPGLIMSLMMSFHSFLTRAKLYQLQNKQPL